MVKKGKPTKEEIEQFLSIFKSSWDGNVIPRTDTRNDDTLLLLGFTPKHRMEECKKLQYTDYFRGPSPDHDGNPAKVWWKFGRMIKGREIYIKIRIYKDGKGRDKAKCMSFHVADWPITYPFKNKE